MGWLDGKWDDVGTTSLTKRESLLETRIRKQRELQESMIRVKQGRLDYLNDNFTEATIPNLQSKGVDADSAYLETELGDNIGVRAPSYLDAPEHSSYKDESTVRDYQRQHYAKLWGWKPEQVTDEHIYAMGQRADDVFKEKYLAGQGTYDPETNTVERAPAPDMEPQLFEPTVNISYNPQDTKRLNETRARASLINPFTKEDIYQGMNTPEYNTRWFADTPEQNRIREMWELKNGSDYTGKFKAPYLFSTTYDNGDGTHTVLSKDGKIARTDVPSEDVDIWRDVIEKQPTAEYADDWSIDRQVQNVKAGAIGFAENVGRALDLTPRSLEEIPEYLATQRDRYQNINVAPGGMQLTPEDLGLDKDIQSINQDLQYVTKDNIAKYKEYAINPELAPEGYKDSAEFKAINTWNEQVFDKNVRDYLSVARHQEELAKLDTRQAKFDYIKSQQIAENPDLGMVDSIIYDLANRKKEFLEVFIQSTPYMAATMVPVVGVTGVAGMKYDDADRKYREKYGEAPDATQKAWMVGTSLLASKFEKIGAEIILGRSKLINSLSQEVFEAMAKKNPLLAKALAVSTTVTVSGLSEAGSEMGTQIFENMASTDFKKEDFVDYFPDSFELKEAAMAGLTGGSSITVTTSTIGQAFNTEARRLKKYTKTLEQDVVDTVKGGTAELTDKDVNSINSRIAKLQQIITTGSGNTAQAQKELDLLNQQLDAGVKPKKALDAKRKAALLQRVEDLSKSVSIKQAPKQRPTTGEATTTTNTEEVTPLTTTEDLKAAYEVLDNPAADTASVRRVLKQLIAYAETKQEESRADPENKELLNEALDVTGKVVTYQEQYNARPDVAKTDPVNNKDDLVYSLDISSDPNLEASLTNLVENGDLNPEELAIVEAKIAAIKALGGVAGRTEGKNLEAVNKDITGKVGESANDFVSFNDYLVLAQNDINKGIPSENNQLRAFSQYMTEKAKAFNKAWTEYKKTGKPQKVTITRPDGTEVTWTVDKRSERLVKTIQKEAKYGQEIVRLVDTLKATAGEAVANVAARNEVRKDEQSIKEQINRLKERAPAKIESSDTGSTQSSQTAETDTVKEESQDSISSPQSSPKSPETQSNATSEAEQTQSVEAEATVETATETPAPNAATQPEAAAAETNTETAPQEETAVETSTLPLLGQTVSEIQEAFRALGVVTNNKSANVKSAGMLRRDQWKAIAEKLGVLPKECKKG